MYDAAEKGEKNNDGEDDDKVGCAVPLECIRFGQGGELRSGPCHLRRGKTGSFGRTAEVGWS